MNKCTILTISAICLFGGIIHAQKINWSNGYIVLKGNQKISGYIISKPDEILFKDSLNGGGAPKIIKPDELDTVFAGGACYVSKFTKLFDFSKFNSEGHGINDRVVADTLYACYLLELLVKGKVDLYKYADNKGKVHFFVQKDTIPITELLYTEYEVINEADAKLWKEYNYYKKQLTYLLADCPKALNKISKLFFSQNAIQELINEYCHCNDTWNVTYQQKVQKAKMSFYLFAGPNLNHWNIKAGSDEMFLVNAKFKSCVSYLFGIGSEIRFPKKEKITLNTEITYDRFFTESHYSYRDKADYAKIDLGILEFDIIGQYLFFKSNFTPYVNFGFSVGYVISNKSDLATVQVRNVGVEEFHDMKTSFLAGLGIKMGKHWRVEVREKRIYPAITTYVLLKETIFAESVHLSYHF